MKDILEVLFCLGFFVGFCVFVFGWVFFFNTVLVQCCSSDWHDFFCNLLQKRNQ